MRSPSDVLGNLIVDMPRECAARRVPIHLTRSRTKSLAAPTPAFHHALGFEALPDAAARPHA
jgi:hypothetical protein